MSGRSKNHTLKGGTSLYNLSMGVTPPLSFLTNVSCKSALSDINTTELAKLFFDAGSQKMIVDKGVGVIAQILTTT